MVDGSNFVELVGVIKDTEVKEVRGGYTLFKGKVEIPFTYTEKATGDSKQGSNYFNIVAWNELATELGGLEEGSHVRVQGSLQTKSYASNCKSCSTEEKKYWTDILVNNFVEL